MFKYINFRQSNNPVEIKYRLTSTSFGHGCGTAGGRSICDRKGFCLQMKEEDGIISRGSVGKDVSGVVQVERLMGAIFGAGAEVGVD